METPARSWAKSIVWRVIGIALMPPIILLVSAVAGNTVGTIALWSTVVFHSLRVVMYYAHERLWERISWGRKTIEEQHGHTGND